MNADNVTPINRGSGSSMPEGLEEHLDKQVTVVHQIMAIVNVVGDLITAKGGRDMEYMSLSLQVAEDMCSRLVDAIDPVNVRKSLS